MFHDKEHNPMVHVCADCSTFVIETTCRLAQVLQETLYAVAHIHTCPMNFEGMTSYQVVWWRKSPNREILFL